MKILFLDIDGVVNCATTPTGIGAVGICPHRAFMVGQITLAHPDLKVVLSSTWRLCPGSYQEVVKHVVPIYASTPSIDGATRGQEIQAWLDKHPEVTKYAILDDDTDMLNEQLPNFFQTTWKDGLTEEIKERVIDHFYDEETT